MYDYLIEYVMRQILTTWHIAVEIQAMDLWCRENM